MELSFEEKLLNAIKKDDLKAFDSLSERGNLGSCRLGRFPVLSLLYLFGARKIISAYELAYLKISSWEELAEPICLSEIFSAKAGKCLRLYLDEIVSPLEMLLILDKTGKVKKNYPIAKPSEAIRKRLKSIYYIKYSSDIVYKGTEIELERRPLNRREKKRIALAALGCLLILAIIVATPVTLTALLPNRAAGEITKLKHIDFSSDREYIVLKDIVLPDNFHVDEVNCSFKGGGGKLIFGKGATLGKFNGALTDITVDTCGSPMFERCTNLARLKNVTINVFADVEAHDDSGFVAITNYGIFDGIRLNVRGKADISLDQAPTEEDDGIIFGGIVANNVYALASTYQRVYGEIRNADVNYYDFSLKGNLNANASFGGIAGLNNAIIEDCSVYGEISSDTVDLGGACYVNNYRISRVTNEASLFELAEDGGWTTVVGGIVIENANVVENCVNLGNISAQSAASAICGGIAARSYWRTDLCVSTGEISVLAKSAYVGGIYGRSELIVYNDGKSIGVADRCLSAAKINVSLTSNEDISCIGGVGGFVVSRISVPAEDENGSPVEDENGDIVYETVYVGGGGVTNSIFIGEMSGNFDWFGCILGMCDSRLYETNYYFSGSNRIANFEGNSYAIGNFSAFGALLLEDDSLVRTADKGAAPADIEAIKNSQLYAEIMSAVNYDGNLANAVA